MTNELRDAITRVLNLSKHPLFHEQTELKSWAGAINDLRVFSQLEDAEDDGSKVGS